MDKGYKNGREREDLEDTKEKNLPARFWQLSGCKQREESKRP